MNALENLTEWIFLLNIVRQGTLKFGQVHGLLILINPIQTKKNQ
ncbi:MAG: hypothetical protein ACTSPZ_10000 [Promethearchaeota archaeon]